MYFGSFVAQALLCVIFWELGTKEAQDDNEESERDSAIFIAIFDEEAEV
jgi:hypothetical protein